MAVFRLGQPKIVQCVSALKGVLLISACYLYKRHRSTKAINQSIRFQTFHHGQDQRAVPGCQGQDCRPTQGWNGLYDHRQAAW